ncbi:SusC/RagA family TonB-linked outer membrane protein [Jiulongibacter sp. NS-SX5]|uniref:SusC/RagA family TonB-linked outer membrane protein n=1 Tax=Jiulongibacter sp. NS-SX5 TaxID=3463854 RepID=UPI004059FF81
MKVKLYLKYLLLVTVGVMATMNVALAQGRKVSGKVVGSDDNLGIPGASVVIQGTSTGTTTDVEGNYSIDVRGNNDVLVVSFVGYNTQTVTVGNQSVINFTLETDVNSLEEIVVTGYQQIRKKDITGAVTVVDAEELKTVKSSSFIQNLAGRASGLTVSSSGSPGDATNVRIRGISSFTSNDPLYIIDGVPVQDKFQNTINPNDIESIQVLKDASAASIYGSRASNGVIVITTKQGKSGKAKLTYNGSYGIANSVRGLDQVLNQSSEYYAEAMRRKFANDPDNIPSWAANPGSLPKYIQPFGDNVDLSTYDILNNQISETNQVGTNWWAESTRPANVNDHSLNLSGGNDAAVFNISASFLNQEGVLNHTFFNRGTIRANSNYKVGKRLRIGENIMFASNWGVGISTQSGNNNEQGILGDIFKATPVVPVYDINGNPGGHLTAQTGNFTNPTQRLEDNKNARDTYRRLLGNIYAELDIVEGLTLKTNFGADVGNGFQKSFTFPQPYRVEGNKTGNTFRESWNQSLSWNWTNTLQYNKTFGNHAVAVLAGQEAIANQFRGYNGSLANYFTTDVNAWYLNTAFGDPGSRSVSSFGNESRLASYFGKVDYTFADKYLLSATIRRDGSSRFLSDVRYGVFPAFSVGWRISQESFMQDLAWLSDLKLRASYGEVGNQQISNYNFADIYGGGVGSTFYDINGTNGGVATGYSLRSRGNASTVWEAAINKNIGLDASLFNNSINVVLDLYDRFTNNLLYNPALPGTAGAAAPPFVNVGEMQNKGFDLAVTYRKNFRNDLGFNATVNLSHYRNEIKAVAGNTDRFYSGGLNSRIPNGDISVVNRVGYPISSFNGYVVDGLIETQEELDMHTGTGAAYIGGLKFRDVNNDGQINGDDITVIGNPHPDLTGGVNLGLNWKNFDVNAFVFGSLGNDIFTGYWIQNYFMNFNSNVIKDILELEGTGTWPKINQLDASSRNTSSFYVQDGSYLRLNNLQIGYTLPVDVSSKAGMSKARIYVQGQNLLTLTGYSGADPAISNANIGNSGNQNDTSMGLDNGNYPSNRIINVGVTLEF